MKRIEVRVCVCAHCVNSGAMDIVESVESLQKLRSQLRTGVSLKLNANESLCGRDQKEISPLVIVNEERIERATSDIVMSRIIAMIKES
jgi:NADH:ubiquinone oxidoreductase subunit E